MDKLNECKSAYAILSSKGHALEVEVYKTPATEKAGIMEEEETESETTSNDRRDTHAKPTPSNEFISIVELFISEGAITALERVNWLFSVYNVYEIRSRIHYLITGVFNRPNETRDTLLKVANALNNSEVWDAFVKIRTLGVNLDGGLHENVTLEVLKLKEALSEEQFAESKQDQWFTWIRKSVQTISESTIA
ncbi:hypothetical protein ACTFIT_003283 [Dictyostelium discoideum]